MKKFVIVVIGLVFAVNAFAQTPDWDLNLLDTARNVNYLTEEEKNVVLELNMARNNPAKYAEMYILPRLEWFIDDNRYRVPGSTITTRTNHTNNRPAVISAINIMSRLPAGLVPLTPSQGMSLAARDHTLDIGLKGIQGHTGSDGSSHNSRVARYGRRSGGGGETLSYGYNTAREIVIQLLQSTGHRNIIMNGTYRYTGLSIGSHSVWNHMCTIKFAGNFTDF
ncbi:MAG: CAP domain-containing protein [Treponema sp.]|nr:CAP domain-containing protein [Treponema sp.]